MTIILVSVSSQDRYSMGKSKTEAKTCAKNEMRIQNGALTFLPIYSSSF